VALASGIYFSRLTAPGGTREQITKLTLVG
jgi:hypothetical protein